MALSASWTHCLIAQSVRASEGNSVVVVISGYQIDNDNAVTIKFTPCIISSIGDTAWEMSGTYQITFANVTFLKKRSS